MGRFSKLTDSDIDGIIDGAVPASGADQELVAFVGELGALARHPDAATTQAHLSVIVDVAAGIARPVADVAGAAIPRSSESTTLRTDRSALMQTKHLSKRAIAAIVAAVSITSFGGVAYAGVLPGPVQDTVSGLAEKVGVDLPDDDGEAEVDDVDDVDGADDADGGAVDSEADDDGVTDDADDADDDTADDAGDEAGEDVDDADDSDSDDDADSDDNADDVDDADDADDADSTDGADDGAGDAGGTDDAVEAEDATDADDSVEGDDLVEGVDEVETADVDDATADNGATGDAADTDDAEADEVD